MSSLTQVALRRVMRDIKQITEDDNLRNNGIFISYNDSDLSVIRAMIIGPKGTPYEGGFYLFEFTMPDDYPFSPPKGKFITRDPNGKCRFHPNLYVEGKICLSILNTWAGPGWVATQCLLSVLLSIQSVMNENPLVNEPNYETVTKGMHDVYNHVVEYENFRVAILHELTVPHGIPNGFGEFLPIMEKYFVDNYQNYIERCSKLSKEFDGRSITSPVYSISANKIDYAGILKSLDKAYSVLTQKYPSSVVPPAVVPKVEVPVNVPISEVVTEVKAEMPKKKLVIVKKKPVTT